MIKITYEVDFNQGGYNERGSFATLLVATQRLKHLRENGFPNAFLIKVTEERIALKDQFLVRTLEQVERFKSKSFAA